MLTLQPSVLSGNAVTGFGSGLSRTGRPSVDNVQGLELGDDLVQHGGAIPISEGKADLRQR